MKRLTKTDILTSSELSPFDTIVVEFPIRLKHLGNVATYKRHGSDRTRWQRLDFIDDEVKSSGFNLKEKELIKFINEINSERGIRITIR